MYIRFTTRFINDDGEEETGIFNALGYIRDHPATQDNDADQLKLLTGWFNAYLEKPTRLSNASSKHSAPISLSWFKDSAIEHIRKTQELIKILERYHVIVERVTSRNPGYVVFEDEHQVSAVPFKTDRARVR